jgi:hypothetical protein
MVLFSRQLMTTAEIFVVFAVKRELNKKTQAVCMV